MDSHTIASLITGVATTIVLSWVARQVGADPNRTGSGCRVLRYNRCIEILGWIMVFLFASGFAFSFRNPDLKDRAIIVSTFAGATLVGFVLARMGRRCVIGYNEEEVYYVPVFGAGFTFRWQSVDSVRYSLIESQWVFRLANGRKIRVSPFMNGYADFIRAARRNVGVPVPSGGFYTA